MLKKIFMLFGVVFFAAMVACAPKLVVQRLDAVERPPNTGNLDIYDSRDAVGRPYKIIAHLDVTDQKSIREENDRYMEEIYATAKEIGADGVIILDHGQTTRRDPDGMGGYVEYTLNYAKGEAIEYE